jgi:probable F420-dependent oxidoreductase
MMTDFSGGIGLALPLPQDGFGGDAFALRDFVQGADELGYEHLSTYDHVVGTDPVQVGTVPVRYTHHSVFHEPLTLLSWIAALTTRIGLTTGILVSPQRQTVLLAKQAAEIDFLSGGRLRQLGVGVGGNTFEYEALGVRFGERGRLLDEQIPILRALWSEPTVSIRAEAFAVTASGLNPRPVQRPIPLWVGGKSPRARRRAAQLGDGHILMTSDPDPSETVAAVLGLVAADGREASDYGFQGFVDVVSGTPADWVARVERLLAAGVTRVSAMTAHPILDQDAGPMTVAAQIARINEVAETLGLGVTSR